MNALSLSQKHAASLGWCLSDTGGAPWVPHVVEQVGGGDVSAEQSFSVPTCAEVLTYMVCHKGARARARGHLGGRPQC